MLKVKDTLRATVHLTFDGRVIKSYHGPNALERFTNEVRVLRHLELRDCPFVPRLLDADAEKVRIITSNCGTRVEHLDETRIKELFAELETFGVRHDDPDIRNVTYRSKDGRFCLIDFEFATILPASSLSSPEGGEGRGEEAKLLSDQIPSPQLSPRLNGERESEATSESTPMNQTFNTLIWSGLSDVGKVRKNNEDSFLGLRFDAHEVHRLGKHGDATTAEADFVFAVSDGMGGAKAGEFASNIAVEKITTLLPKSFRKISSGEDDAVAEVLTKLFHEIHRALVYLGTSYDECHGMETTMSLCWFMPGRVFFGHVGDSRIYHLPAGTAEIKQLTHDDTHVGWLLRNGQINEREARTHPRRNVIQKSLGGGNQFVDPQVGAVECHSGDAFLLCTDGLTEGLYNGHLAEMLQVEDPNISKTLVETAVKNDGRDNTTALVVRVA